MEDTSINKHIMYGVSKYNSINGITCYINSILCILQQTPIFTDYIVTCKFRNNILSNNDENNENLVKGTVIYQLYKLFKTSLENNDSNITPSSFKYLVSVKDSQWGEYKHQDSQDFLTFLLQNLENEDSYKVLFLPGRKFQVSDYTKNKCLLNIVAINKWNQSIEKKDPISKIYPFSPITMLFTGQSISTLKCSFCGYESNTFETFKNLSLPISSENKNNNVSFFKTLDECFEHDHRDEKLDKGDEYECSFCYHKNRGTKKMSIWKTPKILVIQLKRFIKDFYGNPVQKLNNMIDYPIENLDITKYINDNSPYKDKSKYNLFAVNLHHTLGMFNSINFGHYTSIIKSRYDNKWYHFDDGNPIKEISYEKELISSKAYLLFYYRNN